MRDIGTKVFSSRILYDHVLRPQFCHTQYSLCRTDFVRQILPPQNRIGHSFSVSSAALSELFQYGRRTRHRHVQVVIFTDIRRALVLSPARCLHRDFRPFGWLRRSVSAGYSTCCLFLQDAFAVAGNLLSTISPIQYM